MVPSRRCWELGRRSLRGCLTQVTPALERQNGDHAMTNDTMKEMVDSADIAVATEVGLVSIDPDSQSPPAPTGGRLSDHLLRHLGRSETVEQLKPYEAGFEDLGRTVQEFFRLIGGLIQRVAVSPASPGYEPTLIKRGVKPFVARGMAHLVVRTGTRVASEGKRLREVAQPFVSWRNRDGKIGRSSAAPSFCSRLGKKPVWRSQSPSRRRRRPGHSRRCRHLEH